MAGSAVGVASGAAQGAQAGSALGPYGAAIGAVVGAAYAYFGGGGKKTAAVGQGYRWTGTVDATGFHGDLQGLTNVGPHPIPVGENLPHINPLLQPIYSRYFNGESVPVDITAPIGIPGEGMYQYVAGEFEKQAQSRGLLKQLTSGAFMGIAAPDLSNGPQPAGTPTTGGGGGVLPAPVSDVSAQLSQFVALNPLVALLIVGALIYALSKHKG